MPVNEAGIVVGSGSATPSNWTPERVAKLLEIWPMGHSASEAAALIGGVSRNAVIGKVHRLKLPKRPHDSGGRRALDAEALVRKQQEARDRGAHRMRVRRALARGQAAPEFKASDPSEVPTSPSYEGSLRLQFVDLKPGQCNFPEGEEAPFEFCGNPVAGGSSWCHYHQQIVWVKPELRRAASYDANRRGRKVSNHFGSYEAA